MPDANGTQRRGEGPEARAGCLREHCSLVRVRIGYDEIHIRKQIPAKHKEFLDIEDDTTNFGYYLEIVTYK